LHLDYRGVDMHLPHRFFSNGIYEEYVKKNLILKMGRTEQSVFYGKHI